MNLSIGQIIEVKFPSLNKNDKLAHNDKEIARSADVTTCRIERIITLSVKDYAAIGAGLLESNTIWQKIGGSIIHPMHEEGFASICRKAGADPDDICTFTDEVWQAARRFALTLVVAVVCEGLPPFFVNTEGYDYARYVGRAA